MFHDFNMAGFVSGTITISTNVSLFAKTVWNVSEACRTGCPSFDALSHEDVVHVNVEFGTTFTKTASFSLCVGYQVVPKVPIEKNLSTSHFITLEIRRNLYIFEFDSSFQ